MSGHKTMEEWAAEWGRRERAMSGHKPSGHTPGPWHITFYVYQTDNAAPTGRRAQIVSDSRHVGGIMDGAHIAANGGGVCDVKRTGPMAAADARLIAAAPEMLEGLRHVLAMKDDAYLTGHPEWEAICEQAESIIRKATGQEG